MQFKEIEELKKLENTASKLLKKINLETELGQLEAQFLGKKSKFALISKNISHLEVTRKKILGQQLNLYKKNLTLLFSECRNKLSELSTQKTLANCIDVTLPGTGNKTGSIHPIIQTANNIINVLEKLGFTTTRGPQIEHNFYNFDALNMPPTHPARNYQDTFYIIPEIVLRTQTSPVQIRTLYTMKTLPIKITCFGKVYRRDQDISHSPMFHQIEVLYVDYNVSFADLKGMLMLLAKTLFSNKIKLRFRSSFFPFTEPSAEVDISCFNCRKGCALCKNTGWIEILGCGMVHPLVLKNTNFNHKQNNGFAIGMGVERIAMLQYGVSDIKLFYENNIKFLEQF